jgi:hypothetical protein
MKSKFDLAQLCRDVEDRLVPCLSLGAGERALYYHLLRHTHAEGRCVVQISKRVLARGMGMSTTTIHAHLRSLAQKECLKVLERNLSGHVIEVFVPAEIPACRQPRDISEELDLEKVNCYRNERMRAAILRRENSCCFYCLRALKADTAAYDHVVPPAQGGNSTYRNIVACCLECNATKGNGSAADFLRQLYRSGRLTSSDLDSRLAALDSLQRGHLAPTPGHKSLHMQRL